VAMYLGTPTILAGAAAAVAGVSATASLGTPTIVVSSNVAPTGYSVTTSVGTVVFGTGQDVLVRVGAAVIASPTYTDLAGGSHQELPTGYSVTASVGTPTPSVINGATPTGFQVLATASGAGADIDATVEVEGTDLGAMTASLGTPSVAGVGGDNAVFPTGQAVTASLGTPLVNLGPTPAGYGLTASLGTPSVKADVTVSPTGQAGTTGLGTPTLDIGSSQQDALVPVAGFGVTVGFGGAGTTWPVTFDAVGFLLTVGFGVTADHVKIDDVETPTGYGLTAGLGIPQVKVDGSVAPTGQEVTASLGTPTTGGNFTVRPTGFRVVSALGTPTIGGPDLTRPLLVADRSHALYALRDDSGPRYEVTPLAHPRYWIQEVTMARTIYLNNDDEFEFYVTRRNTSTGLVEPAASIAGMTCLLSATKTGTAIDASLEVSAVERASSPGYYYGVMQGSDFNTYLATYVGRTVFRVLKNGSDIVAYTRVTVKAERPIS